MAVVITRQHRLHVGDVKKKKRGESMLRSPPPGQVCTSSQAANAMLRSL